jgi:asparagine synthase (glutamine-hydrolysing)
MLMGNSVEGRFPFLDPDVVEFCNALPPQYKLRRLDEKHLLKRAARDLVPDPILTRPKQPYRAPDAPSFVGDGVECDYLDGVLAERAVRDAGIFEPEGVSRLLAKCRSRVGKGPLSNSDNMAFVGILSTQLLWNRFVRDLPAAPDPGDDAFTTHAEFTGGDGPAARLT